MSPSDEFFPDWGTRPPPPPAGGKDYLFMVVLLGLLALTAVLWVMDPAHQPDGKSRVDWPRPRPHQP